MPAHPRSRGENTASFFGSADTLGSSPLTRGKPGKTDHRKLEPGLIPAHAGKTAGCGLRAIPRGAHPRSRGENVNTLTSARAVEGSSPLTRGKRDRGVCCVSHFGLIPAHAGKTIHPLSSTLPLKAHPRSRGENAGLTAESTN